MHKKCSSYYRYNYSDYDKIFHALLIILVKHQCFAKLIFSSNFSTTKKKQLECLFAWKPSFEMCHRCLFFTIVATFALLCSSCIILVRKWCRTMFTFNFLSGTRRSFKIRKKFEIQFHNCNNSHIIYLTPSLAELTQVKIDFAFALLKTPVERWRIMIINFKEALNSKHRSRFSRGRKFNEIVFITTDH